MQAPEFTSTMPSPSHLLSSPNHTCAPPVPSSHSSSHGTSGSATPQATPPSPNFVRWADGHTEVVSERVEKEILANAGLCIFEDDDEKWRCGYVDQCHYVADRRSVCIKHAMTHLVGWVCGACNKEYSEKRTLSNHKCRAQIPSNPKESHKG